MGSPLFLYGLLPLANPSFEADLDGAAPSSWDTAASVTPDQTVTASVYHSAGHGIPSARSLRQNTTSGAGGAKAVARQRLQAPALLAHLKASGGELGVAACLRGDTSTAIQNASILVLQYQGGSASFGSGTALTAPSDRTFDAGGSDWLLRVRAQGVHASTDWLEVWLQYAPTFGFSAGADAYWDRVFAGGVVDLTKRPRLWKPRVDNGLAINEGDGSVETLRVRKPRTEIDAQWTNLLEDVPASRRQDADALARFERWLEECTGTVAVWADRDELTNRGRHFQRVVVSEDVRLDFPRGILRSEYTFRFIAPSEGVA